MKDDRAAQKRAANLKRQAAKRKYPRVFQDKTCGACFVVPFAGAFGGYIAFIDVDGEASNLDSETREASLESDRDVVELFPKGTT